MRILLADDNPEVRSALRLLLEHEEGLQIVGEAHDVRSMLEQLSSRPFDVVLLDWELPTVRSLHLLRVMRYLRPDVRVVALSGRLNARGESLSAGADAFVSKGDPPTALLSVLRDWVKERKTEKE